jgi:type II secretory pathway pseudopilin PulG
LAAKAQMLYGAVAVIIAIITLLIINSLNAKTSISIHRQPIASYNNCISLFTENYINVKCQDHYWKFGLPTDLKSIVDLAVNEYKSNDVPLSAQALFGPVTANLYQYTKNDFQLGLNNEYGEKLYPVYMINPERF